MFGEYTAHNILIDLDTEQEGDLLSDAPAAEARVPAFHFDYSREQGIATHLLEPMLELFRKRAGAGFGDEDISGVFELIRRQSRVLRRPE